MKLTSLGILIISLFGIQAQTSLASQDQCGPGMCWHQEMGHCMTGPKDEAGSCKLESEKSKTTLHSHVNVIVEGIASSGEQGRKAVVAPGFAMFQVTHELNDRSKIIGTLHVTPDLYTTGKDGIPQIGQYGELKKDGSVHRNSQHNHPLIMGADVRAEMKIRDCESIAVNHAVIGEAPGPEAFMHRESADGNPSAPLTHHNTDLNHITLNVNGVTYKNCRFTVAVAAHSGAEPAPAKPGIRYYKPDSFSASAEYCEDCRVGLGVAFGKILSTHQEVAQIGDEIEDHGGPEHELQFKGWVSTKHDLKTGRLATSSIYGQVRNLDKDFVSHGILTEGTLTRSKNKLFYRAEGQQRRPHAEFDVHGAGDQPQWFKAFTGGYERQILRKGSTSTSVGGSATQTFVPDSMKNYYGGNPLSGEVHFRLNFMKNNSIR